LGGSVAWAATYDDRYLDPALWDNGGTVEAALKWGVRDTRGGWTLGVMATAAGGVAYSRPGAGITTADRYDAQPYARPELEATARRPLGTRLSVAVRGYAAGVFSGDAILAQRRIYAAGADPYQEMSDPFSAQWVRHWRGAPAGVAGRHLAAAICAALIRRCRATDL
jgi:hypothetical protein